MRFDMHFIGMPENYTAAVPFFDKILPFSCSIAVTSDGNLAMGRYKSNMARLYTPDIQLITEIQLQNAGSLRDVEWRCGMLFFTDISERCLHVVNETGPYSHKMTLPFAPVNIDSHAEAMYVSDYIANQIWKITMDGNNAVLNMSVFIPSANLPLSGVYGVAVTGRMVVVASQSSNKIIGFDMLGNQLWSYGGVKGSAEGQLNQPTELVVDNWNRTYIADLGNRRVVVVSADGQLIMNLVSLTGQPRNIWINSDRLNVVQDSRFLSVFTLQ
jgi:hypothetical protein